MSDREHVRGMKKQTDNKFLNMYELNAVDRNGREHPYYFATRRKDGDLMCQTLCCLLITLLAASVKIFRFISPLFSDH